MKRIFTKRFFIAFLLVMLSILGREKATAQEVSYQTFYDELSPYGRWVSYPNYGYVWSPNEGNFRPYSSGGRWAYTNDGWTWVSDYPWGWAPFHYGRWFYDDNYGWLWVPGYEWAPAWVAWRSGGDYYGWAPLRPGFSISVGIGSYAPPSNYWCFVPQRYIYSPQVNNYYVDVHRNRSIIRNTALMNNFTRVNNVYASGPRREDVERVTRQRIQPAEIRASNQPGRPTMGNNTVNIYRPSVNRTNAPNVAPRNPIRYNGNGNGRPAGNSNGNNGNSGRPAGTPGGGNNGNNGRPMGNNNGNNGNSGRPAGTPGGGNNSNNGRPANTSNNNNGRPAGTPNNNNNNNNGNGRSAARPANQPVRTAPANNNRRPVQQQQPANQQRSQPVQQQHTQPVQQRPAQQQQSHPKPVQQQQKQPVQQKQQPAKEQPAQHKEDREPR